MRLVQYPGLSLRSNPGLKLANAFGVEEGGYANAFGVEGGGYANAFGVEGGGYAKRLRR